MEKPAETDHEIHPLLARRWSPRAFSERSVPDGMLASLMEAARWAPSCFNEQPWHFLIARRTDADDFARMLNCLVERNRTWAARAPLLMISIARLRFVQGDKLNRHAFHDVGLAAAALTVQATALGLFVHQMAGFDVEKTRLVYRIPAGFEPVAAIAVGWPGDASELPEELRARELKPRERKPLREMVFSRVWGESVKFAGEDP